MISKFKMVTNGLYRGSAPSPQDVVILHDKYNIKKMVSLDQACGDRIKKICNSLKIKHIIIPMIFDRSSLIMLLQNDLKSLLIDDGPTYVHCFAGKDRTGLVCALFECKYLGIDPDNVISEAKSMGFGIGVDPVITNLYEKVIMACKPSKDINSADIVSNVREYTGEGNDTYLEESGRSSFAPYLDGTREYPYDSVYNWINDQSPTRENYSRTDSYKPMNENDTDTIPSVGLFNNDAGGRGFGPVENVSGFFYD